MLRLEKNEMKRQIKTTLYFIVLLANLGFMQSCIDEDYADCPVPENEEHVRIFLSYIPKTYASVGIEPSEVKSLSLFIFDKQGYFVRSQTERVPVFNQDYYMLVKLNPGVYNFVVWANLEHPYYTNISGSVAETMGIDSTFLFLERPENGLITEKLHPLFFGECRLAEVKSNIEQRFTVPIVQNTNRVSLTVEGLALNNMYRYSITDNNGKYRFDNSFAPDREFQYITPMVVNSTNLLEASLTVLRLGRDRHPILRVHNVTDQRIVFEHDLVDLLVRLEQQNMLIDWVNMHEFDIKLKFGANMEVSISINGWRVIENETEVH